MSKIFVTGPSGNIGRYLVKDLTEAGANFVIGSQSTEAGGNTAEIDLADKASLVKAFAGADTLFLLVPLHEQMVQFGQNAVDAAKEVGVKHIVRSGAGGADASSPLLVQRMQGLLDKLVIDSGISYTILQNSFFMQNWVNFNTNDIKAGTVYSSVGDGKLSWVHTADIAAVAAKVLQNPGAHAGETYVLTGGEALSYAEVTALISEKLVRPVAFVNVPDAAVEEALKGWGMSAWMIEFMITLNNNVAAGKGAGLSQDVQNILGRAPITFSAFVDEVKELWS